MLSLTFIHIFLQKDAHALSRRELPVGLEGGQLAFPLGDVVLGDQARP